MFDVMLSGDGELLSIPCVVAHGNEGLDQHVVAVVHALEAEGVAGCVYLDGSCDHVVSLVLQGRSLDSCVLLSQLSLDFCAGLCAVGVCVSDFLVQGEACAGEVGLVAVDGGVLVNIYTEGEDDNSVPGSEGGAVAVGVVGELDGHLVGVAGSAELSFFVQGRGVVEVDNVASLQGDALSGSSRDDVVALDVEGAALFASAFCNCRVVEGIGQIGAVNGNDQVIVVGQALCLDVVHANIVGLVRVELAGQLEGDLEGNLVFDVVVSGILPVGLVAGGVVSVLDLLLGLGQLFLGVHSDHVLAGGVQHDQRVGILVKAFCRTGLGLNDQVVALVNIGKLVGIGGVVGIHILDQQVNGISKILDLVVLQSCDVFNDLLIGQRFCTVDNSQDSRLVGLVYSISELAAAQVGSAQQLVSAILSAFDIFVIDDDGCGECGGCQTQSHDQGQSHSEELSQVFHNKVPFVFSVFFIFYFSF